MSRDWLTWDEKQQLRRQENRDIWNRAIEESARLVENYERCDIAAEVAAAIRALKDKT